MLLVWDQRATRIKVGQIAFVAVILAVVAILRKLAPMPLSIVQRAAPLVIGVAAGFWVVERTLAIWA